MLSGSEASMKARAEAEASSAPTNYGAEASVG